MSTPNATSIPKGNEKPLYTAKRELKEETGFEVDGEFIDLGELNSPDTRWCMYRPLEKDLDVTNIVSNTFTLVSSCESKIYYNGIAEGHKYPDFYARDEVNPCWLFVFDFNI